MNPSTIRNQSQLMKVREAYLANLELEQRNLKKTADAVSIYNQTGQVPLAPQDTRSVNEKLMDVEKLKIGLRRQLMDITDGQQAADIMNALSDDEIQALSIVMGDISSVLKAKYTNGVPAPIFLEYMRRYLRDYNLNAGLASGNQGVLAEELKLTRDMIQRVMPSPSIMNELMRSISLAPDSKAKDEAILAVSQLATSLPNIDDIAATQSILSEVELANLSSLITDALQTVPSASQVQKLTKEIINTLRDGSKKETENIITKTLNTMKIENAELAQLNSISEALRQEQAESLAPQQQKLSPNTLALVDEIARLANSKTKKVQVRTGEYVKNKKGEVVLEKNGQPKFVTVPKEQLVEKGAITKKDRQVANDILILDRLSPEELAQTKGVSKEGLVKYWDWLSKRDNGIGLRPDELSALSALSKEELMQKVIDGKMGGDLSYVITPKKGKATKKQELQSTASQIGGISAGAQDVVDRAEKDVDSGAIMSEAEYAALSDADKVNYAYRLYELGLLDVNSDAKMRAYDIFNMPAVNMKANTMESLYSDIKRVSGMGLKAKKRSKAQNIVFGCGLVSKPKKAFVEKIDFSEGLPRDKSYIPFGKYVIHKHKLTGGILQVRTIKGGAIPKLPTLGISPSLGKIIKKMVGGGLPTYDEMSSLNEDEKNTLYKVFKLSQVDKADMLPSPDKTKEEEEMNRFQILKGQIQAGNDNSDLVKEFKRMLMRFISGGKIPRGQGMDIVCELMAMGY